MLKKTTYAHRIGLAIGFVIFVAVTSLYIATIPAQVPENNAQLQMEDVEFKTPQQEIINNAAVLQKSVENL